MSDMFSEQTADPIPGAVAELEAQYSRPEPGPVLDPFDGQAIGEFVQAQVDELMQPVYQAVGQFAGVAPTFAGPPGLDQIAAREQGALATIAENHPGVDPQRVLELGSDIARALAEQGAGPLTDDEALRITAFAAEQAQREAAGQTAEHRGQERIHRELDRLDRIYRPGGPASRSEALGREGLLAHAAAVAEASYDPSRHTDPLDAVRDAYQGFRDRGARTGDGKLLARDFAQRAVQHTQARDRHQASPLKVLADTRRDTKQLVAKYAQPNRGGQS